ncbi:hypothetical protein EVAR_56965_1 [Eumeta japonica]|uniref:Uncharacterized protein n=1 Tax=Eumeta variegata TaxID=151549 RepID=A0A4C1YRH4_EUMVA|nr:hypothetical protein EVAR_56965_1 [Eumeta japonica]
MDIDVYLAMERKSREEVAPRPTPCTLQNDVDHPGAAADGRYLPRPLRYLDVWSRSEPSRADRAPARRGGGRARGAEFVTMATRGRPRATSIFAPVRSSADLKGHSTASAGVPLMI